MRKKLVSLLSLVLVLMMAIPSFSPSVAFAAEGEVVQSEENGEEIDDPEDESGEDFVDEEDLEEEDEEEEEDIVLLSEEDEDEELPMEVEEECNFIVAPIEISYKTTTNSRPAVVVTNKDGKTLKKGTEYTVEYVNHEIPGEAMAIVTGMGDYFGTIEVPYRTYYDVRGALDIEVIEDVTYTGKAFTPEPEVSYQGKVLTKDVDYVITYEDNINVGTAKVYIDGIGAYEGRNSTRFRIEKATPTITLSNLKVPYSLEKQTFKLSPKCSNPDAKFSYSVNATNRATVNSGGTVTVQPQYDSSIGTITVKVPATANYKSAKKTIKIVPIVKDFPYKNDTHVYTKISTAGKAVVKQLRNHKKTVVTNFKIKTSKSGVMTCRAIMDYVNPYKTKSWPFEMSESSTGTRFSYDVDLTYSFKYKGYVYGSLVLKPKYKMSKAKEISAVKGIIQTVKDIGAASGSMASRRKKIYTWITKNIRYAYESDGKTPDLDYSTAARTYYYKKGVCEGYAQLLSSMCYVAGVDCIHVQSKTHAWNIMKDGAKWYQCDSCWDAGRGAASWKYYMKPYNSSWKSEKHHVLLSEYTKMDGVTLAK